MAEKTLKEEIKDIAGERPLKKSRKERREERKAARHAEPRRIYPSDKKYRIVLLVMALIAICFLVSMIMMDALPGDLTLILIAIMLGMMAASSILFTSKKKSRRIIGILVALIFAGVFALMTGFMGNTYAMLSKISDSGTTATGPMAKSVGVTEEGFNLYITGIDQWASEKGQDLERSDVNMLVTINPQTKEILLTSIPRDTYVKLHTAQQMDKLTHTGVYGVDETLNTVEDWLGIDINYYVKMNFTGMCAIIDAIDGVDVYSPVAFESSIKGYQYKKGWNHLYGRRALYFARERKSFEGQDSIRVENQQRLMKAVIKKMTSSTTLLTKYGEIMDAAGDNLQTNMATSDMKDLVKMQITELADWDVQTQKVEGEYDQDYVASLTQSMKFDIYRPRESSVRGCISKVREILNPSSSDISDSKRIRSRSFFVNAVKRLTKKEATNDEEQ